MIATVAVVGLTLVVLVAAANVFHFGPIGDRAFKPAHDLIDWFDQTFDAKDENGQLNAEVQAARREAVAGEAAQAENAELRSLIRFDRSGVLPAGQLVTGRVIVRSLEDPFSFLEINRGAEDCVKTGDVAFTGRGLVGKVDSSRRNTARIRLVTNPSSAVSAKVESSGVRGLVKPDPGEPGRLILSFISQTTPPLGAGQEVLTSGWRGNRVSSGFPANIPIGQITSASPSRLEATGSVSIDFFPDLYNLEFVQILTGC